MIDFLIPCLLHHVSIQSLRHSMMLVTYMMMVIFAYKIRAARQLHGKIELS